MIVSDPKNVLTLRNFDRMAIVYLEFLWRNYNCCPFCRCMLLQKCLYIEILLSTFVYALSNVNSSSKTVADKYL